MRDIELWEAAALSLNLEPDKLPVYIGAYERFGDDAFRICPPPFLDRLQVANSNCGIGFAFKFVHKLRARCLVDLPEFAAWAVKQNIRDLPPELVAMAETMPEVPTQPQATTPSRAPLVQATEKKEQRQDRRLKACIDAGLPMNEKAASLRLPDGVGDVADHEGVTRQAFSTDVKAALERRDSAKREGVTVHRT